MGIYFAYLARFVIAAALLYFLYLRFFRKEAGESGGGTEVQSLEPPPDKQVNWIICSRGPLKGKAFFVGGKTVTVGRSPGNFIQIVDDEVSRVHCQLIPAEGGLRLVDMDSRNGVVVNGKAVKETVLPHRGVFRIGESVFSFLEKGTFSTDAGLLGKFGGRGAESETRLVNTAELRRLLEGEIKAANGDLGKAAENLGVEVAFLESMLHDTIPPDA